MDALSVIIGADIVPTKSNESLFISGDAESLFGEGILELLRRSDFRIFNLEAPLCDTKSPIPKIGPNLGACEAAVAGIRALAPTVLALANNHILDHGGRGLARTVELLGENGISCVGAGADLAAASRPCILAKDGVKIGVHACAEHEFSIAENGKAGANPFDPLETPDRVAELKARCDAVIVLYHGGKEFYRYPSPRLRKVCRKLADKGADLVVCQHSHCVGCYEEYGGSRIVYGQGNFLFDGSDGEAWKTGLLLRFMPGGAPALRFIPIVKYGGRVRLAPDEEAGEILADFEARSRDIRQAGFVEKAYREQAAREYTSCCREVAGWGNWAARLDHRLFRDRLIRKKYSLQHLLQLHNVLECEARLELLRACIRYGERELEQ